MSAESCTEKSSRRYEGRSEKSRYPSSAGCTAETGTGIREYRKVPEERLMARLGLTRYDKDAPLKEELVQVKKVRILLSQHIGAPAQAVVKAGDEVTRGQMIAQPAQGLSVGIHASVSGKVTEVTDRYIIIAVK